MWKTLRATLCSTLCNSLWLYVNFFKPQSFTEYGTELLREAVGRIPFHVSPLTKMWKTNPSQNAPKSGHLSFGKSGKVVSKKSPKGSYGQPSDI